MKKDRPEYERYAKLLYEIIRVDIGRTALEVAIFDQMRRSQASEWIVQSIMMEDQRKGQKVLDDLNYGLGGSSPSFTAYFSWSAFNEGAPQALRTTWHWELRSYFGLSYI